MSSKKCNVCDSVCSESCKQDFKVAGDVLSNRSCFACGMESVRRKPLEYVGTRRKTSVALKRASRSGGGGVCQFIMGCVI